MSELASQANVMVHSVPLAVFALSGIATIIMGVLFSALSKSFPKTIKGPKQWEGGILLFAVAFLLFSASNYIGFLASIITANTAVIFGLILINAGLRHFFSGTPTYKRSTVLGFVLVYLSVLLWSALDEGSRPLIGFVFAVGSSIVILDTIVVLLRNVRYGSGVLIVLAAFSIPLVVRLTRIVIILRGGEVSLHISDPSPLHLIFLAAPMLAVPIGTIGFLWLIAQRLLREIKDLNRHDELTDCLKKNVFKDELSREINRTTRTQKPLCVMMIDLDDFKQVNDKLGHQRGDEVLRLATDLLKVAIRKTDFIGRYGGDEFCVTLPEADAAEATDIAKRILDLAQAQEAKEVGISFSIGIAALTNASETPDAVLTRADEALYRAKSAGKSQLAVNLAN